MNNTQTHEEMVAALVAKLPPTKCCPKCRQEKLIESGFGLRTSYKGDRVVRVQVQSQCRLCRSGKVAAVVVVQPVVETWMDAVLLALGGSKATKLADIYTTIEGLASMKGKLASNKNWKAKVRQTLQTLRGKNQVKAPSVGVWQLAF